MHGDVDECIEIAAQRSWTLPFGEGASRRVPDVRQTFSPTKIKVPPNARNRAERPCTFPSPVESPSPRRSSVRDAPLPSQPSNHGIVHRHENSDLKYVNKRRRPLSTVALSSPHRALEISQCVTRTNSTNAKMATMTRSISQMSP